MLFFSKKREVPRHIEALEKDLQTPQEEDAIMLDLRGVSAYRLTARMALILGGVLLLMILPTRAEPNWILNLVAAMLVFIIGFGLHKFIRKYTPSP